MVEEVDTVTIELLAPDVMFGPVQLTLPLQPNAVSEAGEPAQTVVLLTVKVVGATPVTVTLADLLQPGCTVQVTEYTLAPTTGCTTAVVAVPLMLPLKVPVQPLAVKVRLCPVTTVRALTVSVTLGIGTTVTVPTAEVEEVSPVQVTV